MENSVNKKEQITEILREHSCEDEYYDSLYLYDTQFEDVATAIDNLYRDEWINNENIRKVFYDNAYYDDYGNRLMGFNDFNAAIKSLLLPEQ